MNNVNKYCFEYGQELVDFVESIVYRAKESGEKEPSSGLRARLFDDYLIPGNYILLGGDAGIGKSFLVYDMIKEIFAKRVKSVALFSLASTYRQVMIELTGRFVGIRPLPLSTGLLIPNEWDRLDKKIGAFMDFQDLRQLFIDTTPFMTLEYLEKSLKDFVDHGCEFAFIDYVQLLNVESKDFPNLYEKMTYISHYLKNLSKLHNIPIVVVSQLTRQGTDEKSLYREDRLFFLSDFRDSGAFEEDADVVMMVDRPEARHVYQDSFGRDLHDVMKVMVLKDRNSHLTGEILLYYDYNEMEFSDYPRVKINYDED